jgi:hypothetical protein
VRQSLALKHALFVSIADSTALVELCGAMGIAAKFTHSTFSWSFAVSGDGMVEAHHNICTFFKASRPLPTSSTV